MIDWARHGKMKGLDILGIFKRNGITYFTGVPDSTFAGFINELYSAEGITHRISVNECEATFLAGAYNVSTGNYGVVYMQNAGLGKAVNPITSYLIPYKIPVLLLIGWRGEPGEEDEPQHIYMGDITLRLLGLLGISYDILSDNLIVLESQIIYAKKYMELNKKPYALVIRKNNNIEGKKLSSMDEFLGNEKKGKILREDVVKAVIHNMNPKDIIVSTTGKVSRELYEFR